jgi:ABC-2 type transport system permease protein
MTEELRMDRRANLRAMWTFVKRDLKIWTYFKLNFLIDIAGIFSNLAIYAIIAIVAGQAVKASLNPYGGDYVSYVILGIIFNEILSTSLSAPYWGTMDAFWSGRLEILMISPISTPLFVTGTSIGRYVRSFINVLIYLVFGFLLFGLRLGGSANYGLAILYILVAAVACTGLGLMGASLIYLIEARGGEDPIRWIVGILVGLASGVYYPLSILPPWMQWLGCLIPQTYALDGARRAVIGGGIDAKTLPIQALSALSPLLVDMIALLAFSIVTLPLGWWMYNQGVRRAKTDGRLSRWV